MEDITYSVKALPTGKFYVRMRSKALKIDTSKGTFRTEDEAITYKMVLESGGPKAVAPVEASVEERGQLTETFLLRWMENKAQSKELEPTTMRHVRQLMANHIIPFFGHMQLSAVTNQHARYFIAYMNTKLAGSTVNNVRMWANNAFLSAVEDGLIAGSPFTKVKGAKVHGGIKAARCPTSEQVQELLSWLEKNPAWGFPIRTALYTGMRRGELVALIWRDIDLRRGSLSITRSVANAGAGDYRKTPKTSSSNRTIYLVPQILAEMRAEFAKLLATGLPRQDAMNLPVFLTPDGTRPTLNYFGDCIGDRLAAAGMKNADGETYTLHDLRHHHATHLLREKEAVKIVSQRLGHSSVMTTMNIYQHVTKEDDRNLSDATSRIGARLAEPVDAISP